MENSNMDDSYSVKVGEDFDFKLSKDTISSLDLIKTGENTFHLLKNGVSYHLKIMASDFTEAYIMSALTVPNSRPQYKHHWMSSSKKWDLQ